MAPLQRSVLQRLKRGWMLTHWILEDVAEIINVKVSNTCFWQCDQHFEHFLWNCPQVRWINTVQIHLFLPLLFSNDITFNTFRPEQNGWHIWTNAIHWMKIIAFFYSHFNPIYCWGPGKLVLVQVMAWYRMSKKPLPEPVMIKITDINASLSHKGLITPVGHFKHQ